MANNKDFKVKNGIQPTVYHEGVGTVTSGSVGYSLASASYDSVSFSIGSEEAVPYKIRFNNDGTKLYVLGVVGDDVNQYTLSTAFDISTASYDSVSFSVASQETDPYGLAFNNDGTKMYITGNTSDSIFEYTLSTGFDLSTASYNSVSLSVTSQDTIPTGIAFNSTGSKLYMIGQISDQIHQYSLSTDFDLSTASYDSVSFSIASEETSPMDISFNSDGTKMYMVGASSDTVFQYSLSTAFDISTASYDSISFSVNPQESNPRAVVFNNDGTKMYIIGSTTDAVHQYSTVQTTNTLDLSTGSVFEITPTSDIQINLSNPADSGTVSQATLLLDGAAATGYDFSVASYDNKSLDTGSQQTNPLAIQISEDGTKFYVAGSTGDEMHQYTLTTPYDITTATYENVSFDHSSENGTIQGIRFANDPTDTTTYGKRMYLLGTATSKVVSQYTLSTAWDISTATFDSPTFSIATQVTGTARSLSFSADGSSFFVLDESDDVLYQYDMTTPWDLSTASYASKSLDVTAEESIPQGHSFNADGTELFVIGESGGDVNKYTLTTGFDISTASFDSVVFTPGSEFTQANVRDAIFNKGGTKFYLVENVSDFVLQYSTAAAATITYDSTIEFAGGTAPTSPAIGETDVLTFTTRDGGTSYQAVQAINGAK